MQLLDQLKKQGHTVKFTHIRKFRLPSIGYFYGTRYEHPAIPPEPNGGSTLCTIYDADGQFLTSAASRCSDRDNFSKKRGMVIALGRAYCQLSGEAERRKARNTTVYPVV